MDAQHVLEQGLSFTVVGPFLVADMTGRPAPQPGQHGAEVVPPRGATEMHSHEFVSFYYTEGLDVRSLAGARYVLPERALVLVLPGVPHSWLARAVAGTVGSVGHQHPRQVVRAAAAA